MSVCASPLVLSPEKKMEKNGGEMENYQLEHRYKQITESGPY